MCDSDKAIRWSHSASVRNRFNRYALGDQDSCILSPLQSVCESSVSQFADIRIISPLGIVASRNALVDSKSAKALQAKGDVDTCSGKRKEVICESFRHEYVPKLV